MKGKKIYSITHLASAVLMILLLMWLTVSTPFIIKHQQASQNLCGIEKSDVPSSPDEDNNPLGNSNEEKVPKSLPTISEEYLHQYFSLDGFIATSIHKYCTQNVELYHAFHGELLVPPPNVS